MKFIVRDPAANPAAMQQALTALVDEKPDVIVVQNPSVTLLMRRQPTFSVSFAAFQYSASSASVWG